MAVSSHLDILFDNFIALPHSNVRKILISQIEKYNWNLVKKETYFSIFTVGSFNQNRL